MVIPEDSDPYLQIRNLSLYPDELRDHDAYMPEFKRNCQCASKTLRKSACPGFVRAALAVD